jgi:hypothetical protein
VVQATTAVVEGVVFPAVQLGSPLRQLPKFPQSSLSAAVQLLALSADSHEAWSKLPMGMFTPQAAALVL